MSKSDPRTSSLEFVSDEELRGEIEAGPAMAERIPGAKPVEQDVRNILTPKERDRGCRSNRSLSSRPRRNKPRGSRSQRAVSPAAPITGTALGQRGAAHQCRASYRRSSALAPGSGQSSKRRIVTLAAMPYRAKLTGGERDFDLGLKADRAALLDAITGEDDAPSRENLSRSRASQTSRHCHKRSAREPAWTYHQSKQNARISSSREPGGC